MINFEDNFCSFEQSKRLKELGFNGKCIYFRLQENDRNRISLNPNNFNSESYGGTTSIPLRSQALAFFREKFGLYGWTFPQMKPKGNFGWGLNIVILDQTTVLVDGLESPSEAENALIDRLIEIVKEKTNGK